MKCNDAEKYMLLNDSGELSDNHVQALDAHVVSCPSCRQFMQILQEASSLVELAEEPSAKSIQDVLRAARVNVPIREHHSVFGYKSVLAAAASIAVLLGLLFGNLNSNKIGLEMFLTEAQLLDSEDQVVSVMYDGLSEDDLAFNFLMTYEENLEG